MDADENLLFGVLALQVDLIDAGQFAETCTLWTARKETPLADLLVELGWISEADKGDVDRRRRIARRPRVATRADGVLHARDCQSRHDREALDGHELPPMARTARTGEFSL